MINESHIANLKEKREQAIRDWDRETYVKITGKLGLDLGEVPNLAKEPEERDDLEKIVLEESGKIGNISLKTDKNKEYVEIINSRSLQNIKQPKTRQKLKGILGLLQRKGYETNYSPNMNTTEMWNCYFEDRRHILSL